MRRSPPILPALAAVLSLTAILTCTDQPDHDLTGPTGPGSAATQRPRYITPTGLVTSTPPEIFSGAGDIADCGNNNDEATAKLLDGLPGKVYTLGDNAYSSGSAAQYTNCYQPTWGRHKARTYPSAGNKEYDSQNATPYFNYFGSAAGTAGQGWYSFVLGGWRVIVLNSNISKTAGSAQLTWLSAQLTADTHLCTLAYFHHPLYSSTGGSGSGGVTYSSVKPFYDVLYAQGADLVLSGHRHFYERMAPMKPDGSADPAFGLRQIIVGTGGTGGGTVTNVFPRSEVRNGSTFGVLKLYLYDDSYAWKFLPVAGKTFSDSGSTACHGSPGSGGSQVSAALSTVSASPAGLTAGSGSSTITVTARDANGNPVSGATVTLAASGTGNTLTQPSSPTGVNGVATGSLSSTGAGTKTVSATAGGTAISQTAGISVTAAAPSAGHSSVTANPTQIAAGTGTSTITVTVRDAFDNPVQGSTVALAATGTGNTLTQPSNPTGVNGATTGTLASTDPELKTVSATADGSPITQTAPVTVLPPGGATIGQSLLTAGNDPANVKIYTTASIAPAPNTLVTIAVAGHRSTGAPPSPTITGGGMSSWSEVVSTSFDSLPDLHKRVTLFRAMSPAPGSGPITITWSATVSNTQWIVSQWSGVDGSGNNGAGAIVQTTSERADNVSTLTATLAPLASPGNVALGVVANNATGLVITPGPGFTEIAEQSSGESPRSVLETEWAAGSATIAPTWPGSLDAAILAAELKAAGP